MWITEKHWIPKDLGMGTTLPKSRSNVELFHIVGHVIATKCHALWPEWTISQRLWYLQILLQTDFYISLEILLTQRMQALKRENSFLVTGCCMTKRSWSLRCHANSKAIQAKYSWFFWCYEGSLTRWVVVWKAKFKTVAQEECLEAASQNCDQKCATYQLCKHQPMKWIR